MKTTGLLFDDSLLRPTVYRQLERASIHNLLKYSRSGDLSARHELVGRYQSIIFSTAYHLVANRQDAEDLATDIYLHIFNVINSCNNIKTLPGWIKRVSTNEIYRAWRRKGRRPLHVSLEALVEANGEKILGTDENQNPATILLSKVGQTERSERLQKALLSLPSTQRDLCKMHYEDRRTFEDISQETGIAIGTIKSRLFRARGTMNRKLGDLVIG